MPTEHNKHPNMVVIRSPNLLRKPPVMGPRKVATPIATEDTHAATEMESFVLVLRMLEYAKHLNRLRQVNPKTDCGSIVELGQEWSFVTS